MKHFIITIDTEGDNLWKWKPGQEVTTKNVQYLKRFQELCAQYGFKPVWLSNWEMISDPLFVEFINRNVEAGNCELGMHLHAWNNPPFYELPRDERSGAPYLIEYPREIMEAKIAAITEKMKEQFGYVPVSHRAGRWIAPTRRESAGGIPWGRLRALQDRITGKLPGIFRNIRALWRFRLPWSIPTGCFWIKTKAGNPM